MRFNRSGGAVASAVAASLLLSGCPGESTWTPEQNVKPAFVGTVTKSTYDGVNDDLLTAGLGKTGLQGAAPSIAVATSPTATELRRLAIYNNYRALVDVATNGGYGTLYGPNIDANGNPTLGEGKVAGTEYLAYADDGTGKLNVTMMVQIPASFSADAACMVTAPSSGSRGVYGAIGTAGEWGLKHGCVVAYTDKGTGNGIQDLASNTVTLQNGIRSDAASAGKGSNFTADLSAADLAAYNTAWPNRQAVKHTHSQQNPEKDWGNDVLNAVRFAFYVLNEERAGRNTDGTAKVEFKPTNVVVIASSASNGGGASIAAVEQDTEGLIDGLAVSEPNVNLQPGGNLIVVRGTTTLNGTGRPLVDYFTLANLLQPCAALSSAAQGSPGAAFINTTLATNRCNALKAKGYLSGATAADMATDAMNQLVAYGWQPESNILHASLYGLNATPSIANAYANTYGRFGVKDNLCGLSYASTDAANKPTAIPAATLAQEFGTSNGIPPTTGINIVNNDSVGGPVNSVVSVSPSTGVTDYNVDGAVCQRDLWTGTSANAARVKAGVAQIYRTANLRGKPAIIVHGRDDGLIPVSFSSRPYYGMNKTVEGASSKLSYIEVTNAQHFDTFIDNAALPGYDSRFIPLHYYFNKAMDAVYANLKSSTPLPQSQVVRTVPRGGTPGAAPPITTANVPPMAQTPAAGNAITFSGNTLNIPN